MNDFLKMDIFFAMTTAVVVLLGLFALVALFYVIKILRNVDHVARNVSTESDNIRDDLQILRHKVRDEGMKIKHLMDFWSGVTARNSGGRRKSSKKDGE